ncbi:MAG TPA: LamG-like jellyroll fold domain-containing protein [Pyrinomonadaceae bacterium]|nr:LamG-like jellyroll fold domain-containing protein [Pyrinomonadaceae bacterium]
MINHPDKSRARYFHQLKPSTAQSTVRQRFLLCVVLAAVVSTTTGLAIFRSTSAFASGTWATKAPMPEAREQSGSAAYGGLLYMFGGGLSNVPLVYDPVTDSWSTRAPDSSARCNPAVLIYNGKIHVIGGWFNCDFNTPTTVHRIYDPVANTWSNATSALVARGETASGLIGGKFYLTAGGASFPGAFNQTEIYDPVTDTWVFGAPIPIAVRKPGSAVIGGKLYVVSGQDAANVFRSEVQIYDPVSNSWSFAAPIPTARKSPLVGVIGGKLYAATGLNGAELTTLEIYDIASDSWTTGPSSTTPRWLGVGEVINSKFYIAGGRTVGGGDTASLEVFTPEESIPTPTPTPVCTSPPANMVSWWPGDGHADDIQGGNNGTPLNGATFAPGKVGSAFSFDGVDDFVTLPYRPSLNLTQALSIDAWVKPSVANLYGGIVEKTVNDHVNTQYMMDLEGGVVFFRLIVIPGVDHRTVRSNLPIPVNEWTHVAGTWDGSLMRLFINGVEQTETVAVSPPINSGAGPTRIGSLGDNVYRFNGLIDEVEIFNRALSTAEIVALYLADSAGKCKDIDQCPDDLNKTAPGACGCGVPDTDNDGDGIANCQDNCPNNFNPDQTDGDGDGVGDLCDSCANDPNKVTPGECGCGVPDTDSDHDGSPDCFDACPTDPNKTSPGLCGCGVIDTDTDDDGTADCSDACPNDRDKTAPGACGCGVPDTDTDGDSIPDCHDNCRTTFNPDQSDSNGDGVGDACSSVPFPSGGAFVIGDNVNLATGATVYFWGAQWSQNNPMSGGAAPNSFKGFENGSQQPACGGTWASQPGNSSSPPPAVPQFMAVIVSSSIQKNGSVITGNVRKIVIVQTNPGYGPSPGQAGTGKVVSVYCVSGSSASLLDELFSSGDAKGFIPFYRQEIYPVGRSFGS